MIRSFALLSLLAVLASCAHPPPPDFVGSWTGMAVYAGNGRAMLTPEQLQLAQAQAAVYRAHAAKSYRAPGPVDDLWGAYIQEAAARFSIPERWIREVMRQESGGRQHGADGSLTTSWAGAMGLMQVMPGTYEAMRRRYGLGADPYDPHNNIMAGAAYIREMFDRYGSPGFLAAYNAGPLRVDAYLAGGASLPDETRHYVARIAPRLGTNELGNTEQQAVAAAMPVAPVPVASVPGASVPGAMVRYGSAAGGDMRPASLDVASTAPVDVPPYAAMAATATPLAVVSAPETPVAAVPLMPVASLALPHPMAFHVATRVAFHPPPAAPAPPQPGTPQPGTSAVEPAIYTIPAAHQPYYNDPFAVAEAAPVAKWGVEIGTYPDQDTSRMAVQTASAAMPRTYASAQPVITPLQREGGTLYQAELMGLPGEAAVSVCDSMIRRGLHCMTVPPGS